MNNHEEECEQSDEEPPGANNQSPIATPPLIPIAAFSDPNLNPNDTPRRKINGQANPSAAGKSRSNNGRMTVIHSQSQPVGPFRADFRGSR
ncbi:MAG: hypothetical protein JW829_09840 [Pirellulales bacterium]|nr:hypothetical protein [Pirellulales bacterium]